MRGRSCGAPHQLPPPIFVPLKRKYAVSSTSTKSAKRAISAPPPTQAPWIEKTTGFPRPTMTSETPIIRSKKCVRPAASLVRTDWAISMSPPAQNARPAPRTTTTPTVSSAPASRSDCRSSSYVCTRRALSFSGRSSVIVAMPRSAPYWMSWYVAAVKAC